MFASLFSFRAILLAGGMMFLAGGYVGHEVTMWYYQAQISGDDLKREKARVKALEDNLALIKKVLETDGKSAEDDLKALEELKRKANAIVEKVPAGGGLSPTTDRMLREYFTTGTSAVRLGSSAKRSPRVLPPANRVPGKGPVQREGNR